MRPAAALQGLIEIRGLGIVRVPFERVAVAHLVVDIETANLARLPARADLVTSIEGIRLARLPVAPGPEAQARLLGFLRCGADFCLLPDA
jgi:hypothetical protein